MDIDMPEMGQSQQAKDIGNPSCPEHTEEALRVNGTVPNQKEATALGRSHTTALEQQHEGIVEDVTGRSEAYADDRTMEGGTSSQPPQRKGKQPIARSRRKQAATTIVLPHILEGVHTTPNVLGCVEKLQYSDQDVADVDKFSEFAKQVYLDSVGTGPFGDPILQLKQWAVRSANIEILNLLDIPHFGRSRDVNNCVKQLMAATHGGYLWVEEPVSIDVELITFIIGMPSRGENPMQYFDDKTQEKVLAEEMKKTYDTERGSRGIIIKRISDATTRLATKLMACKLLRKCRKEEALAGVVAAVAQCAEGTMLSWALYLLNPFLED
jgi:hypothetical protein